MSFNFTDPQSTLRKRWFPDIPDSMGDVEKVGRNVSRLGSTWSTAQIMLAVTVGLVAVSAGLAGYAGLIVSSITTFNLNNYYYGKIGELSTAILQTDAPLFYNTSTVPTTVYITCSGGNSNFCSYVSYLNTSISSFNSSIASINSSIASINSSIISINNYIAFNGNITLSTLNYTNGASFMNGVTNGKAALDSLVNEDISLQTQINSLATANGTFTLSTLPYINGASFMGNVTNGKAGLDNLVGEAIVLQNQINNLPPPPTLTTLSYTNGASFMGNATNGKGALDNLVGEAIVLQNQINVLKAGIGSTYYVETSANGGVDASGCGRNILQPCATVDYVVSLISVHSSDAMVIIRLGTGNFTSGTLPLPCNTIVQGANIGTLWAYTAISPNAATVVLGHCYYVFSALRMQGVQSMSIVGVSNITDYRLYYTNDTFVNGGSMDIRGNGALGNLILEDVSTSGGVSSIYIQDMDVTTLGTVSLDISSLIYIVDVLRAGYNVLRGWEIGSGGLLMNATATGTTKYFVYGMNNLHVAAWYTCTGSGATMVVDGDTSVGLQNFNNTSGPIEICGVGNRTITPEIGANGMFIIPVAVDSPNFANVTRTTVQAIITDNANRIRQIELLKEINSYRGENVTNISTSSAGSVCTNNINLSSGTVYTTGQTIFAANTPFTFLLSYTGSTKKHFDFQLSALTFFSISATTAQFIVAQAYITVNGVIGTDSTYQYIPVNIAETSYNIDFQFTKSIILNPGDYLGLYLYYRTQASTSTTFTDCGLIPVNPAIIPFFKIIQYS